MQKDRSQELTRALQVVSDEAQVSVVDLKSQTRLRVVADARKMFFYAVRKNQGLNFSLKEIGRVVNRDHATVLVGMREAENLRVVDKCFDKTLTRITAMLHVSGIGALMNEFDNVPQF